MRECHRQVNSSASVPRTPDTFNVMRTRTCIWSMNMVYIALYTSFVGDDSGLSAKLTQLRSNQSCQRLIYLKIGVLITIIC